MADAVDDATAHEPDRDPEADLPRSGSGRHGRHGKRPATKDIHAHGTKSVVMALFANMAIAIAKFVGFAVTGASSMLAEGVHSVADSGNQLLLLLGGRRAKKAADEEHPFGYGRERYFWAFVVAVVLFTVGAVFAIYEGIHKIEHPEAIEDPKWAFGILGFAFVAELISFRTAVGEARLAKGDAGYWTFIRRAKAPEIPVVLLEDFAALVGLVFALTGVGLSVALDDGRYDGAGSIAIGVLLALVAITLAIEMKSLLIGESANRKDREAIKAAIEIEPEVVELIHLRTEHLGPEELLVAAKVEFFHELSVVEVADVVDRVERNIRDHVASARVIYLEPDVHRRHRMANPYVVEHEGRLTRDDPLWAEITGATAVVDPDRPRPR